MDLSRANLVAARLSGARLRGATLRGANLRGADLNHADVAAHTLLEAADLDQALVNLTAFQRGGGHPTSWPSSGLAVPSSSLLTRFPPMHETP